MGEMVGGSGERRRRRRRRSSGRAGVAAGRSWPSLRVSLPSVSASGAGLVVLVLALLVLALPLMMGHRTPETLTLTGLVLTCGALLAVLASGWKGAGDHALPMPTTGWWVFFALMTLAVLLQVLPIRTLALWFGPYPDTLWDHPAFEPRSWSPNPAWAVRSWVIFVALFAVAWLAGCLKTRQRNWIWLAITVMAIFQGIYGLASHASGAESIFGIWERNNDRFVHGSFSNRNLYAGYLSLAWPLVVTVWWLRDMPGISRLPMELKVTGSVISGAIIGAALIGSGSRLGSVGGVIGMLTLLLFWTRYRGHLRGIAVWPVWLGAFAAFLLATWYGLAPLTDRLSVTTMEERRFQVFALMFTDFPRWWWLTGVGLGGFEAVFKLIQPEEMSGWWDYAHNDLLQWILEMGLTGAVLLGMAIAAILKNASINLERIPLYSGLVALVVISLGDFSWHIPGTQVVLAIFIGILVRPERSPKSMNGNEKNKRRRRRSPDQRLQHQGNS
jgi:putative inorganic carbon (hco3(-)) transporter